MRRYYIFLAVLLMAAGLLAGAAWQRAAATAPQAMRIEADQAAGVIRFFIDGEERAVLGADGLHISGSIEYTGAIADTAAQGPAHPNRGDGQ